VEKAKESFANFPSMIPSLAACQQVCEEAYEPWPRKTRAWTTHRASAFPKGTVPRTIQGPPNDGELKHSIEKFTGEVEH
jgi:hypothetical protein